MKDIEKVFATWKAYVEELRPRYPEIIATTNEI